AVQMHRHPAGTGDQPDRARSPQVVVETLDRAVGEMEVHIPRGVEVDDLVTGGTERLARAASGRTGRKVGPGEQLLHGSLCRCHALMVACSTSVHHELDVP